eukprot:TRINITY_DN16352_c0_g1_i1.p1 TRINITY_DN16352_c0_g1~~TRINITY_DN16352_c0_g1_i1.p1  ORF type:complete len:314 (+),score=78.07 TRINITY_DN16352_c0_g1_i1:392-1333(+)
MSRLAADGTESTTSKLLKPGSTIFKIGSPDHELAQEGKKESFGEWTWADADTFNVRVGPDYQINKQKAPSEHAIYECFACDVYSLEKKQWHMARCFDVFQPQLKEETKDVSQDEQQFLPEYLLLSVLSPCYAPGIFYPVTDGKGFVTFIFHKLTDYAKECIKNNNITPAMQLLKTFMDEASESPEMRGRFKGIVRATNLDEIAFNPILTGFAHRYNSTPFLIHHNEARYFTGSNYFEIDVDMHSWSLFSRNAFYQLNHMLKEIRAHFAFVVESRSNEELPEQLLSVTELAGIRNMDCIPFPLQDIDDESQSYE